MYMELRVHGEGAALSPEQIDAIQKLVRDRGASAADVYGSPKPGYVRVVVAVGSVLIAPDGTVSASD